MVELNFDRAPPARAARPHPGRASWPSGTRDDGRAADRRRASPTRRSIDELGDRLPGPGDRRRARSARRRSATAARSAATSAPPRRPATRCRRCSPPTPRSSSRRCAARGGVPVAEFFTGPKRNALAPDELIAAFRMPRRRRPAAVREDRHPQRDGDRGLLVRARAGPRRSGAVGAGIGSAGADAASAPARPRRSSPACSTRTACGSRAAPLPDAALAARSASWSAPRPRPIDDVRGTRRLPPPRARRAGRGARSPGPGTEYREAA